MAPNIWTLRIQVEPKKLQGKRFSMLLSASRQAAPLTEKLKSGWLLEPANGQGKKPYRGPVQKCRHLTPQPRGAAWPVGL